MRRVSREKEVRRFIRRFVEPHLSRGALVDERKEAPVKIIFTGAMPDIEILHGVSLIYMDLGWLVYIREIHGPFWKLEFYRGIPSDPEGLITPKEILDIFRWWKTERGADALRRKLYARETKLQSVK